MKGFSKFLLVVFSIIIICLAIFVVLLSTEMISANGIFSRFVMLAIQNKITFLVGASVVILLGLVGLFTSDSSDEMKTGLVLKTEKGNVCITKETFESIIVSVARNYPELRNVRVDIKLSDTGLIANVYTMILPDTVVPALTAKLQEHIKTSILKQTTVEIKEANIKIKGVYLEPQKK